MMLGGGGVGAADWEDARWGKPWALNVGSPTPSRIRLPCRTPSPSRSPSATTLVVQVRDSTGNRAKAAAVVTSLVFEAGVKRWVSFKPNSGCPSRVVMLMPKWAWLRAGSARMALMRPARGPVNGAGGWAGWAGSWAVSPAEETKTKASNNAEDGRKSVMGEFSRRESVRGVPSKGNVVFRIATI